MATAEGDKDAGYGLIKVPKATSDVCSSNIVYLNYAFFPLDCINPRDLLVVML